MGSRGSFLESGGYSTPARWQTVDYINGVKVVAPKDPSASRNLPERSNTPGTAYVSYRKDGTFNQYIEFGNDRKPIYRIDFGIHRGKKTLHIHYYKDGNTIPNLHNLKKGDLLYEKYKRLFKEVK